MLLTDPASAQARLYVPGATICLGSAAADMRSSYGLDFTQVEVDRALGVPGAFRFTIPRAFDIEKHDFRTPRGEPLMPLLKLGQPVWIKMGYGDSAHQTLLISGGIQPGILQDKNGFLNLRIPGTMPTGTELLLFLEAETITRGRTRPGADG